MVERELNAYQKEVIEKNKPPQSPKAARNHWKIEGA